MRKILGIVVLMCLFLSSCVDRQSYMERRAERQTEHVIRAIRSSDIDSIWQAVHEWDKTIFLIYSGGELIFWSDNGLTRKIPPTPDYSAKWIDYTFDNADTRVMWTHTGALEVMTIIPMEWHIMGLEELEHSFSYLPLQEQGRRNWWKATRIRARAYTILFIVLVLIALGWVIWLLRTHKGFDNINLRNKVQVVLMLTLVVFCIIAGLSFIHFERVRYMNQQYTRLQEKCQHVQTALQNLYYWDLRLSRMNTQGLNVDLRDLAHSYVSDIHVFDMNGVIVGSSTPQLFNEQLLNRHMAPEVFFSDKATTIIHEQIGSVKYIAAYTPFYNGSHVQLGYISMPFFMSEEAQAADVDALLARLLPPFFVMLLMMLLISSIFAHRMSKPLRELTENMKHYRPGKDVSHIDYPYNDEIGAVVEHYNEMVDRLNDYMRRLATSEREGAWRTMARQIAHEINNPLTPMKLSIQQLQRLKGDPRFDEQFERASQMLVEQIDNLSRIAGSFSTFAKMPAVYAEHIDVAEKLCSAKALYDHNDRHIPIRYLGPDRGVTAWADGEQLMQVFANILKNAIQALDGQKDGDIIIRLEEQADEVCITFSDNGPGIPEEIRDKIFMPNFTTKSTGTGLGLAISKSIIESCEGRILCPPSKKGAIFLVYLKKKQ
ncbi:MAG: HAMP domain-containing protein [Paludibacteraceae bacterium]|nr:HAMP domain-containing protein [Paludibacteraceae bacterium]